MIDPTNSGEFAAFAIQAWKEKVPNLRLVVDLWMSYLRAQEPGFDMRRDPASKLIISLLATQTGIGIHDISTPQACTQEIRRVRN